MSNAPQCPSTVGNKPENPGPTTGRAYWSSLDELSQTKEFQEFAQREFPAFASEMLSSNRRTFLKLMGASVALAGAAASVPGCRRPDHRILAYSKDPEHVIPGRPLYIASAMPLAGGGCEGLLVETHTGRPTKVEGNPLHPINLGATSVAAQASVLNLYDPDRAPGVTRKGDEDEDGNPTRVESSWDELDGYISSSFRRFDANSSNGAGLFFLVGKSSSPSRDAMRSRILARWPQATWLPYEAVDDESGRDGSQIAFGSPHARRYSLENAKVIVALGADFLGEDGCVNDSRGFAAGRKVDDQDDAPHLSMNRLYSIESDLTLTGAAADHRLRAKPSEVERLALRLCAETLRQLGSGGQLASAADRKGEGEILAGDAHRNELADEWVTEAAKDLASARGAGVLIGGPGLSAPTRALIDATNEALGAFGNTVHLTEMTGDERESSLRSITRLAAAIQSRQVGTLVVLGANPVYDAPADLGFAELFANVPISIVCNESENETSLGAMWSCNRAHYLESWGDARAADGTLTVIQPMIEPLFDGRSDLEFLATIAGAEQTDGYEIVKTTWTAGPLASAASADKAWKRALHDGVFTPGGRTAQPRVNANAVSQELAGWSPAPVADLEVVFKPCAKVGDGRGANNGWLQELPDPMSKVTWDNPALISPTTAKALGIKDLQKGLKAHSGQMITLDIDGRSVEVPVWISPGIAEGTVVLTIGYGRTHAGRIGNGVGFDVYPLRATNTMRHGAATLAGTAGGHEIACVQDHWSLEGRTYYREADLDLYDAHKDEHVEFTDAYGRTKDLTFAQRLGEESHTPVNETIYQEDQQHDYSVGPQWGMAIDMNACTGCAACTIACQAENNIPVVGKSQVLNGREMHWIRVDRYYADRPFTGAENGGANTQGMGDVDVAIQPVTCMHCENAPCESVCPVNATTHGPSGTNDMAYNRCIGTRYCGNNCPYKVRRFNFFDYATKRLNGDYVGKEVLGGVVKEGHLIPPRLREKIEDDAGAIQVMQYNPDVTVRSRGVMEKCTFCIQRVNWARTEAKLDGVWGETTDDPAMPDGYVKTACQQVCSADAIIFGDILDPNSKVSKAKKSAREYGMLDYLNVLPRTTYQIRLRNPNPAITRPEVHNPLEHGGGGHDDHGDDAHGEESHDDGHVMSLPVFNGSGNGAKNIPGALASKPAELIQRIETGIETMITSVGGSA